VRSQLSEVPRKTSPASADALAGLVQGTQS
jgi:hypothetical protein